MPHEITMGKILIQDHALLPKGLQLESEPCVPGWSAVNNFDASALNGEIQKTGWTFLCLAAVIKATVFGMDRQKMVRRAIERILASAKSEKFNSLEITRVAFEPSGRFPLVGYVTVSAQSRHIQEGLSLFPPQEPPTLERKSELPGQGTKIASDRTPGSQEPLRLRV